MRAEPRRGRPRPAPQSCQRLEPTRAAVRRGRGDRKRRGGAALAAPRSPAGRWPGGFPPPLAGWLSSRRGAGREASRRVRLCLTLLSTYSLKSGGCTSPAAAGVKPLGSPGAFSRPWPCSRLTKPSGPGEARLGDENAARSSLERGNCSAAGRGSGSTGVRSGGAIGSAVGAGACQAGPRRRQAAGQGAPGEAFELWWHLATTGCRQPSGEIQRT